MHKLGNRIWVQGDNNEGSEVITRFFSFCLVLRSWKCWEVEGGLAEIGCEKAKDDDEEDQHLPQVRSGDIHNGTHSSNNMVNSDSATFAYPEVNEPIRSSSPSYGALEWVLGKYKQESIWILSNVCTMKVTEQHMPFLISLTKWFHFPPLYINISFLWWRRLNLLYLTHKK